MTFKDSTIAILVVVIWSINLLVQKYLVGQVDVFLISFLRVALLLPFIFLFPSKPKNLPRYFICSLFWFVAYLILFGFGLKFNMGAGVASLFLQTQVFFGLLFCYLLLGEKPSSNQTIGTALAFSGLCAISTQGELENLTLSGAFFLLLSCISWGFGFALLKKFQIGKTIKDVVWLSSISAAPLLLINIYISGVFGFVNKLFDIDAVSWTAIFYGSVGSTLLGTFLWIGLSQRIKAAALAPYMLLLPVISTALSALIMGEAPTELQFISGVVIMFGVALSQNLHYILINQIKIKAMQND